MASKGIMKTTLEKMLRDLKSIYTDTWFLPKDNWASAVDVWHRALGSFTYDQLHAAFNAYVERESKPPVPSQIRELVYELQDNQGAASSITDTFILWSVTDKETGMRVCQDILANSRFSNLDILKDVKEKVGDGDYIVRRIG